MLYGGDDIEDGLNSIPLNPVASTIQKTEDVKTSYVGAKLTPVNVGA
jgi:hypothetical protein